MSSYFPFYYWVLFWVCLIWEETTSRFKGFLFPPLTRLKWTLSLQCRDMKEMSFLLRYGYNTDIITLRRMWYRITCFSRSDLRCRNISRFDDRCYFFLIFLRFDSLCCPPSQGFHDFCLCLLLKLALISWLRFCWCTDNLLPTDYYWPFTPHAIAIEIAIKLLSLV